MELDIYDVVLRKKVEDDLKKIPNHIIAKLISWISAIAHDGLSEVRRIPGYHDEPLKGNRHDQRSIRLSKSYRAIYMIDKSGQIDVVEIVEVNKHDY